MRGLLLASTILLVAAGCGGDENEPVPNEDLPSALRTPADELAAAGVDIEARALDAVGAADVPALIVDGDTDSALVVYEGDPVSPDLGPAGYDISNQILCRNGVIVAGARVSEITAVLRQVDFCEPSGSAPPAGKGNLLELTLDPDGPDGTKPLTASIDCPDPPRPGPDELCGEVLLLSPEDLGPVPADVPCPEIYGGPDTLQVEGTLEGKPVEATLTRENGCEIDRFDNWAGVMSEAFDGYRPGSALEAG